MRINSTPQFKSLGNAAPGGPSQVSFSKMSSGASDFYDRHPQLTHMAGGALLGVGLARAVGLPPEASISAATSGAICGFFAGGSKDRALSMAGFSAVGAGIAAVAGCPAATIVGAAGTGAIVGWLFN